MPKSLENLSVVQNDVDDKMQHIRTEVEKFISLNFMEPISTYEAEANSQDLAIPTFLRRRRRQEDEHEISSRLSKRTATFTEQLLEMIVETGMSETEVYKRAHMDRKLYSKIKNDKDYRPSKRTAIALIFDEGKEEEIPPTYSTFIQHYFHTEPNEKAASPDGVGAF
ncbi:protein of unknown function [Petrocella atlantisensis]|uniref:Uncharacterized protein n=1 Tax=Petrocella atlantisensis TaxID=2173034 RepID=A0A3P7PEZ0_9FIRM|nr:hypothetical protein [Petrocella atlantisensis]VDN47478.1 protein of unknown function [Petrocella atlantisensis]